MTAFERPGLNKPSVVGEQGMVVAKHPIAAEVGTQVLRTGGNAVDAAIATTFALGVVEPYMSGIGGVGIGLWWDGETVREIDGYTRAPKALDVADFALESGSDTELFGWPKVVSDRNIYGCTSVAVPTMVAMMQWLHERGASKPWKELLQPAISLARDGWKVDWLTTLNIAESQEALLRYPTSARVFLPEGRVPHCDLNLTGGVTFRQADLAATLQTLADEGPWSFYQGRIAEQLTRFVQSEGGYLSADDLSDYTVRSGTPLTVHLNGSEVWLPGGLNGGPTVAEILQMMSLKTWSEDDWGSNEMVKHWIQAGLLAFSDRLEKMGAGAETPELWTSDYAVSRWGQGFTTIGQRAPDSTTHLVVVDGNGHGVSLNLTLLSRWGSHVVAGNTGILLNNGVMWFDPRPGCPNSLTPGATPLANMAPLLVTRQSQLQGLIGSSGGRKIMCANAQILYNLLIHGMPAQRAVEAPRVDFSGPAIMLDPRLQCQSDLLQAAFNVEMREVTPSLGGMEYASAVAIWSRAGAWEGGADAHGLATALAP